MIWWKKAKRAAGVPTGAVDIQAVFRAGFQQHQAGRLAEAASAYRQVLAVEPDHFDARHLLGVIALQEGRLADAKAEIAGALRLNPSHVDALSNLGAALLRSGELAQARTCLESALSLRPDHRDAASNLATVLVRLGEPGAAVPQLRKVLAGRNDDRLSRQLADTLLAAGDAAGAAQQYRGLLLQHADRPDLHNNLGMALERQGDIDGALACYERAAALDGGFLDARNNRAALLARSGRLAEARSILEGMLLLHPDQPAVHANLGALYRDMGELELARERLDHALRLAPGLYPARLNAASVAVALRSPEANSALRALRREFPRAAEVLVLHARAALADDRLEQAAADASQALELDAALAEAHHVLGLVQMAGGDHVAARASHRRAVTLAPDDVQARWAEVMARLPTLRREPGDSADSQAAFVEGLSELDAWLQGPMAATGSAAVGSTQPFYLAYQPGNHRRLMSAYGQLCHRLMQTGLKPEPPAPRPAAPRPLRVGVVSAHLRNHSVWTALLRGWMRHIDRGRFEIELFDLGHSPDEQTREAHALAARVHKGPPSARAWVQRVRDSSPDVLLFPEVGMDATTAKLAALRLAPLQLAAWGHPLTTGLPSIDAFVSAEALEPDDARAHYSEELLALPGLGVCYEPLKVAGVPPDLERLGLPTQAPLLLCPGLPHKYGPEHDDVWVQIAARLPEARLVFFAAGAPRIAAALKRRLGAAFERHGLDLARHVTFVPRLDRPVFFGLMQQSTLFLDSIGFSGFNTAMQALECGLPIIALEGDSLRGRFGSGILRQIGLPDCVAASPVDYVERAVCLARDPARLTAVREHLRLHAGALFADQAPVRALEDFLVARVRRSA